MDGVVIDTSVAIAVLNARDAHHQAAVDALHRYRVDDRLLPLIAFAELLVGAHRRGPDAVSTIEAFAAQAVRVADLSHDVVRTAARLRAAEVGLSLPDTIVIATGAHHDAAVLTCDRRWGTITDAVRDRIQVIGDSDTA